MAEDNENSIPTKRELTLDMLATTLMDLIALAGIVLVIPYAKDDLVGTIAVMLLFAALGAAYTVAVFVEDRRQLKKNALQAHSGELG